MIKEWFAKQKAKVALLQVFKNGEMGVSYSYGENKGKIYPKIRSVRFDYKKKSVIYAFSIPTGMDPKEIKKKDYCFQQGFGKNIEIKGDTKEFSLTFYTTVLPSELTYEFGTYSPLFKGMAMPIVVGLDLNGNIIVYDMVKNPHLLIAGETGSGRSTQLRSVLTTLIKTMPPER